jgi:hypothetical protein
MKIGSYYRIYLPNNAYGIVIIFEYGSSSTGITVTSSLSYENLSPSNIPGGILYSIILFTISIALSLSI